MRKQYLKQIRRVVIKVGSRVLTDESGSLDSAVIRQLCGDLATLHSQGYRWCWFLPAPLPQGVTLWA